MHFIYLFCAHICSHVDNYWGQQQPWQSAAKNGAQQTKSICLVYQLLFCVLTTCTPKDEFKSFSRNDTAQSYIRTNWWLRSHTYIKIFQSRGSRLKEAATYCRREMCIKKINYRGCRSALLELPSQKQYKESAEEAHKKLLLFRCTCCCSRKIYSLQWQKNVLLAVGLIFILYFLSNNLLLDLFRVCLYVYCAYYKIWLCWFFSWIICT